VGKDAGNKSRRSRFSVSIENQKHAAYYDIEELQPDSKVPIPTLEGVIRAKEWIEENQK